MKESRVIRQLLQGSHGGLLNKLKVKRLNRNNNGSLAMCYMSTTDHKTFSIKVDKQTVAVCENTKRRDGHFTDKHMSLFSEVRAY